MNGYETYVLYCAMKNHFFTEKYDFFKYNGKVKVNVESYETRKDKFYFEKLAKRKDCKEFLLANFAAMNGRMWIGELINNEVTERAYMDWKRRTQALSYNFEEDLKKLLPNLDENLIINESQHPYLLKMFLRKKISIETLVILEHLLGFFAQWNRKLKNDIIWKEIHDMCLKYRAFLSYDKQRMKAVARKVFDCEHSNAA